MLTTSSNPDGPLKHPKSFKSLYQLHQCHSWDLGPSTQVQGWISFPVGPWSQHWSGFESRCLYEPLNSSSMTQSWVSPTMCRLSNLMATKTSYFYPYFAKCLSDIVISSWLTVEYIVTWLCLLLESVFIVSVVLVVSSDNDRLKNIHWLNSEAVQ